MLLFTSPTEGLAWLQALDEDWARHYTVSRARAERREDETADTPS